MLRNFKIYVCIFIKIDRQCCYIDRQMDRQVDGWDSRAVGSKFSKEWETVGGESHDTRRERDRQRDGETDRAELWKNVESKFVMIPIEYHICKTLRFCSWTVTISLQKDHQNTSQGRIQDFF